MANAIRGRAPQNARWQQVKMVALRRWELLTAEDLDDVHGNTERMIALLQQRYGFAREEATRELTAWSQSLHTPASVPAAVISAAR